MRNARKNAKKLGLLPKITKRDYTKEEQKHINALRIIEENNPRPSDCIRKQIEYYERHGLKW